METSTMLWLLVCVLTGLTLWLAFWASEKKSNFCQVLPVVLALVTLVVMWRADEATKKERLEYHAVTTAQRGDK